MPQYSDAHTDTYRIVIGIYIYKTLFPNFK